MDILNFISWIKAGKYSPTMPADAITVVGVPNTTRGDAYLPATVPVTALQTNIGKLMGGGIVVGEWFENGVHKALIASLTNLSTSRPWMISPYNTTLVGPTAQSYSNGSTNTDAIIAKTGVPATTAYAAGLTKLYLGGGFTDWYLPAVWELNMCFNSAAIVNKVLGNVNGFFANNAYYWSSTEFNFSSAFRMYFINGTLNSTTKTAGSYVRAVRIHTL
jgi:trimeric autotransporter adhesin